MSKKSNKHQSFSCGGTSLGYAGSGFTGLGYANKCFVAQSTQGCRACLPQSCDCKRCSH